MSPFPRPLWLWAGAVALLAIAVYANTLGHEFAWDDDRFVRGNEAVREARLGELLTTPYVRDVHPMRSPYRPVPAISYAVDWAIGGGDPLPLHATNVLLHAVASVLVLLLLARLGLAGGAAGFGAAIFALHPIHTEAVANISGRPDVVMTVAVLAGALIYLRRSWPAPGRALGVAVAFAVAIGSKENAITFPALLVLLEACRPDRDRRLLPSLWTERWAFLGIASVAGAYAAARYAVVGTFTTLDIAPYLATVPALPRASTAVANVPEYLRLLLFPADLSVEYGPPLVDVVTPSQPHFWIGLALAAALGGLAWALRRTRPLVTLAILWLGVTVLPVSNLLVPIAIWIGERTLYLPSVAVSLVAAVTAREALRAPARTRRLAVGGAAVVLLLAAGRSWSRNATWHDTETVLTALIEDHPESFRGAWALALRLEERGDVTRALELYEYAAALVPNSAYLLFDYARALILGDRPTEAEALLRPVPRQLSPTWHVYMAQSLIEQGRDAEALTVVRDGLQRFPGENRLMGQARRLGMDEARTPSPDSAQTPG